MSCHGCATSFGFFCREYECKNCGFAFCNKCLRMKCVVPKLGSEQRVCRPCYTALVEHAGEPAAAKEYSPPSAFLRRLESLEDPNRPPIVVYQHDQRMQQLKTGLEEPDRQIAERLEKLREEVRVKPVPTEEEVIQRLRQLKGQGSLPREKVDCTADVRTDEEKVEGLIQQYLEERQLDSKLPDPEQEITARLANLRMHAQDDLPAMECEPGRKLSDGAGRSGLETASLDEVTALLSQVQTELQPEDESDVDSEGKKCLREMVFKLKTKQLEMYGEGDLDEEGHVQEIVSWAMAEAKLRKLKATDEVLSSEDEMSTSSEENISDPLQTCVICDGEATWKCRGCSGDLYCNDCFVRGHTEWDMKDHVACEFKQQNTE